MQNADIRPILSFIFSGNFDAEKVIKNVKNVAAHFFFADALESWYSCQAKGGFSGYLG